MQTKLQWLSFTNKSISLQTEIYANQESDVRHIKHFHYTGWPDMKVPEFAEPVLKFLDHANTSSSPHAGPIIVHCRQV